MLAYSGGSDPATWLEVKSSVASAGWRENDTGSVPARHRACQHARRTPPGMPGRRQLFGHAGTCSRRSAGSCIARLHGYPRLHSLAAAYGHDQHLTWNCTQWKRRFRAAGRREAGQRAASPPMALNLSRSSNRLGKPVPQLAGSVPRRPHPDIHSSCSLAICFQLSGSVPGVHKPFEVAEARSMWLNAGLHVSSCRQAPVYCTAQTHMQIHAGHAGSVHEGWVACRQREQWVDISQVTAHAGLTNPSNSSRGGNTR